MKRSLVLGVVAASMAFCAVPARSQGLSESPSQPLSLTEPASGDVAGPLYSASCASCSNPSEEPLRLLPYGLFGRGVIDVYGWLDGGVTFNDDHPPSNFNGVTTFNDRQNEFQVNQIYLVFERAVETGPSAGWDVGGRFDLLHGTDSRFVEVEGLGGTGGDGWNGERFYGLTIPQMYLELAYNRLSVKMGRFYTILGCESTMAPDNFFYSHAYTMQYGEPFTHTGMLFSYAIGDRLTLLAGFDRGWDKFNPAPDGDDLGFLGGLTWENESSGTSIAWTCSATSESANPFIPGLKDDRFVYSLVIQQKLAQRFTYVFQHDLGVQQTGSPFTGRAAEWYGICQYLFYELSPKWDLGLRVEWYRDDDGLTVGGIGDRIKGSPIVPYGFAGNFYNVTLGANWKPNANVVVRPEVRFDWYDGISGFGPRPFSDGGDDDQVTAAIDFIFEF